MAIVIFPVPCFILLCFQSLFEFDRHFPDFIHCFDAISVSCSFKPHFFGCVTTFIGFYSQVFLVRSASVVEYNRTFLGLINRNSPSLPMKCGWNPPLPIPHPVFGTFSSHGPACSGPRIPRDPKQQHQGGWRCPGDGAF